MPGIPFLEAFALGLFIALAVVTFSALGYISCWLTRRIMDFLDRWER